MIAGDGYVTLIFGICCLIKHGGWKYIKKGEGSTIFHKPAKYNSKFVFRLRSVEERASAGLIDLFRG